jgi:hypothetical protein
MLWQILLISKRGLQRSLITLDLLQATFQYTNKAWNTVIYTKLITHIWAEGGRDVATHPVSILHLTFNDSTDSSQCWLWDVGRQLRLEWSQTHRKRESQHKELMIPLCNLPAEYRRPLYHSMNENKDLIGNWGPAVKLWFSPTTGLQTHCSISAPLGGSYCKE